MNNPIFSKKNRKIACWAPYFYLSICLGFICLWLAYQHIDTTPTYPTLVCPQGISQSTRDGTCSLCDNGHVYLPYMKDPCQYAVTGCTSNDDCDKNEYCALVSNNNNHWSCEYPAQGTCQPLGKKQSAQINGKILIKSDDYMPWWAANNWCKSQGKKLLDISEFECYHSNSDLLVLENTDYKGACCAEKQSCTEIDAWFQPSRKSNYSSFIYELKQAFGTNAYLWTASNHYNNNFCGAMIIDLRYGAVSAFYRYGDYQACFALCE